MSDVKWIKITTDMFDNRKIKHLRKLPEGNNIVLIWVMLLTMAGKCNEKGKIFLTENIPYTTKMLADELDFEENTVKLAIQALEELEMIFVNENFFVIPGWSKHQNVEGMDKIREQNRIRKRKQREKQKLTLEDKSHVMSRDSHATDKNKIRKEEIRIDYESIVQMYNDHCPSLPTVRSLSEARKKAIRARLNSYSAEDFKQLFIKAEKSDFLKGKNNRNWSATFDWLIKDANMAKVLDGNYDNKHPGNAKSSNTQNMDDLDGIF